MGKHIAEKLTNQWYKSERAFYRQIDDTMKEQKIRIKRGEKIAEQMQKIAELEAENKKLKAEEAENKKLKADLEIAERRVDWLMHTFAIVEGMSPERKQEIRDALNKHSAEFGFEYKPQEKENKE